MFSTYTQEMIGTPPPPDASDNTSILLDSPDSGDPDWTVFPELSLFTPDSFDDSSWQAPDELAVTREQLQQTQNALAQTARELARTQAALQKEKQENESLEKRNESLCKLNDLLFQERRTYQNIEQMQPASINHRDQNSSVGSAQQHQRLGETPRHSSATAELIHGSDVCSILCDQPILDESISTDVSSNGSTLSAVPNNSNQSNPVTPSPASEGNGTRSNTEADTVPMNVDYEEDVRSASEVSTASSNQCASSSTRIPRPSRQNGRSGAQPVPVELPNGFHEIDLNPLVESQSLLRPHRCFAIKDTLGQPFALQLNENQLPARGKMHMALACRSEHGYYSCLFQLCDQNKQAHDVITRPFEWGGTNQQQISIGELSMKKICDDQIYKPGVQKRDDKMTFILKAFPFDGPTEKQEVLGTSNKKLFEEYSLKKPRLIIWFTDQTDRIHRPTFDVTSPTLESVDQDTSVHSAVFNSSNLYELSFPLKINEVDANVPSTPAVKEGPLQRLGDFIEVDQHSNEVLLRSTANVSRTVNNEEQQGTAKRSNDGDPFAARSTSSKFPKIGDANLDRIF